MIVAALVLLAVGVADLIRQFVSERRRWMGLTIAGAAIVVLGILAGAWLAGLLAIVFAILWVWLMPSHHAGRGGFWPVVVLGMICAGFVAALGTRPEAGVIGAVWNLPSPVGHITFDQSLFVIGTVCFLLESANVVVRAALSEEHVSAAQAIDGESEGDAVVQPGLKGGRLIGPLERVLVFALTLAGIVGLLAAILAAKGIVRFPEISRDRDNGNRAEYFLVGSLVSWTIALAAAFLVWWGTASS